MKTMIKKYENNAADNALAAASLETYKKGTLSPLLIHNLSLLPILIQNLPLLYVDTQFVTFTDFDTKLATFTNFTNFDTQLVTLPILPILIQNLSLLRQIFEFFIPMKIMPSQMLHCGNW